MNNIVKLAYDQGVRQALADFGLAKLGEDGSGLSAPGALLGGIGGAMLGGLLPRRGVGGLLGMAAGAGLGAKFGPRGEQPAREDLGLEDSHTPSPHTPDNIMDRLTTVPYSGSHVIGPGGTGNPFTTPFNHNTY